MATKNRMQDYRARLRKQGLRPVQVWVPDQRASGFESELRRQIQALDTQDERESLEWIEQVADWPEE